MRVPRLASVALLAVTTSAPRIAGAQTAPAGATSRNACLDAIPDSALHRVPVYLTASPTDSSAPRVPLQDGIDLLTQTIAQTARSLLPPEEGPLPVGEPALGWRVLEGNVLVVARRNGALSARVVPPSTPEEEWLEDAGARFVA